MGVFKKIFTHDNFGARDEDYPRWRLFVAKIIYDLMQIVIIGLAYYFIFVGVRKVFEIKDIFISNPPFGVRLDLWNAYIYRFPFLIINFVIYILFKLLHKISCPRRSQLGIPLLIRLVYLLVRVAIEIALIVLLSHLGFSLNGFKLPFMNEYCTIAYVYFFLIRIALITLITEPLWFARARRNTKDTGYKDSGFYLAFWCGDAYYVGTANDGVGKRMYNYHTGLGSVDGDKFKISRLGIRFVVVPSNNPDFFETLFYFFFGAPYKNKESPILSHTTHPDDY